MSSFVIVALAVIIGLHVLLYRRLAIAPGWPRRARIAIATAVAVLFVLFFMSLRSLWAPVLSPDAARPLAWIGMGWLAFAMYLALGLLVVALVAGALALRGRDESRNRRRTANRVGSLAALAVATATTTYGLAEASGPSVTEWTVRSATLPEQLDGLRVVLLSDLHIGAVYSDSLAREVVEIANAADPDIVVLPGDLGEGSPQRYGDQLAPLADLVAELGVFATTGNHEFISGDPEGWLAAWEDAGITPLRNESVLIEKDGGRIHLAGVHDVTGEGELSPDPQAALAGVAEEEFVIYLAHQPSQAADVEGKGVDLQLSGHTHGGQLWPFQYAVRAAQPMLDGRATVGDVEVITSRGAGAWGPPVRVGAPPEIPVITLERG